MKLLIYSRAFAPMVGGVETVVMSLAKGLATAEHTDGFEKPEVTVATPASPGSFNDAALPFRVVRQPSLLRLLNLVWDADLLHLAGPALLPMFLGFVLRKPYVVEHHGFQAVCPNGLLLHEPTQSPCPGHFMAGRHAECIHCNLQLGRLGSRRSWVLTFARRRLAARAGFNLTPTHWLEELLNLPRSKTIYHGLPETSSSGKPQYSSACKSFAFVGRLVSTKGVHSLLLAVHQLWREGFEFRLKLIGDGPERPGLEREAVALGLKEYVQFLGFLPEIEEHLRDVEAVIMPSLAGEVFGLAAAENMLRGKLMITSTAGALKEVVGDFGLLFPPGDIRCLADCLRRVLVEPDLAKLLGERARERAFQLFQEGQMVAEHLACYRQILQGSFAATEPQHAVSQPIPRP